jgi:hypothetical protein
LQLSSLHWNTTEAVVAHVASAAQLTFASAGDRPVADGKHMRVVLVRLSLAWLSILTHVAHRGTLCWLQHTTFGFRPASRPSSSLRLASLAPPTARLAGLGLAAPSTDGHFFNTETHSSTNLNTSTSGGIECKLTLAVPRSLLAPNLGPGLRGTVRRDLHVSIPPTKVLEKADGSFAVVLAEDCQRDHDMLMPVDTDSSSCAVEELSAGALSAAAVQLTPNKPAPPASANLKSSGMITMPVPAVSPIRRQGSSSIRTLGTSVVAPASPGSPAAAAAAANASKKRSRPPQVLVIIISVWLHRVSLASLGG